MQMLLTDGRGYLFVGKRAWFIEEQSTVYVGVQILLVNRKVSQMSSVSFSRSFTRLLTATEPENRSTQKNCQQ
jgi:hypothetical protein